MGKDDSIVEKQGLKARKAAFEREIERKEREIERKEREIERELRELNSYKAQLDAIVIAEKNDLVKQVHALNLRTE